MRSCHGRPRRHGKHCITDRRLKVMLWLHVLQNLKRLPKCFTDIKERTENKYIHWILINYSVLKICSGLCMFPCLRSPVIILSLKRLVSCSLPASVRPREPAADLQGEDSAFVRHPHSQPVWGRVSDQSSKTHQKSAHKITFSHLCLHTDCWLGGKLTRRKKPYRWEAVTTFPYFCYLILLQTNEADDLLTRDLTSNPGYGLAP